MFCACFTEHYKIKYYFKEGGRRAGQEDLCSPHELTFLLSAHPSTCVLGFGRFPSLLRDVFFTGWLDRCMELFDAPKEEGGFSTSFGGRFGEAPAFVHELVKVCEGKGRRDDCKCYCQGGPVKIPWKIPVAIGRGCRRISGDISFGVRTNRVLVVLVESRSSPVHRLWCRTRKIRNTCDSACTVIRRAISFGDRDAIFCHHPSPRCLSE